MKPKYRADGESFVIENYNSAPPFSDFFPGLAGLTGKPMWVFFTNRGQGIAGFGVNNKDGAMMEFQPANKAYQATSLLGFRTFLKSTKSGSTSIEAFSPLNTVVNSQSMVLRPYELEIKEKIPSLGIEVTVVYFGVPNEDCPVLARRLTIKNISSKPVNVQVVDGLPRVVPAGMGDFMVKNMSRTIEAFAETLNVKASIPFFKLKVEPDDKPNIKWLETGFFSFGIFNGLFVPPIVDPSVVFGQDTSFLSPVEPLEKIKAGQNQMVSNILPCAFYSQALSLPSKASRDFTSYFGYAENLHGADQFAQRVKENASYFDEKREEVKQVYLEVIEQIGLQTGNENLNQYGRNTFLDNVLRGGLPITFGANGPVAHVYSRKHGDMERDYNAFQLTSSYYSQGNGNFRDVNQNRRNDLFINSKVGTSNIEMFFNTLQLDGFNPLVVNPLKFWVPKDMLVRMNVSMSDRYRSDYLGLMKNPVILGRIYEFVKKHSDEPLNVNQQFKDVMAGCTPVSMLEHGEGYWSDHWTYSLDHIDQYLATYPEKKVWVLFEKTDFTFYDTEYFIRPRREKYVVAMNGKLRQYNAVISNPQKKALLESRSADPNMVRIDNGTGAIFTCTFFIKLLSLAVVKISSLDPYGVGIEMEADKPGWCDALNGLPGLFGSSSHETFELKRLVLFLLSEALPVSPNKAVDIPSEVYSFMRRIDEGFEKEQPKDFRDTWEAMSTAREDFREKTLMGLSGKLRNIKIIEIRTFLTKCLGVLERATQKAFDPKTGIPTSYFTYDVDVSNLADGWRQFLHTLPWHQHRVVPFLEGSVHALKGSTPVQAKKLYQSVRKSELYDPKLGMYKLNSSLKDESWELGRIKVFSPGWLENESVFLHMHYKYMLELLKSGQTDAFFNESEKALIPFRDPEKYGRSIYQNSSFIASSSFPDASCHGRGYVARLSGATSEFLSMIYLLAFGSNFLRADEGGLLFDPTPTLPKEWFTTKDEPMFPKHSFSIRLFGVPVTYVNSKNKNTFGKGSVKPAEYEWILDGRFYRVEDRRLANEPTQALRDGRIEKLTIFLR